MMSSKPTAGDFGASRSDDELKPGTTLLRGQYVIEKFLNNGGFGITYLAKDSLHRMVVIKECYPESICRRSASTVRVRSRSQVEAFRTIVDLFIEEARKLARLSHPNIVGVHQVFEDNDTAYMAMDFVEGRDLLEIVESGATLEPATLERMVIRLLDAIEFIHHQGLLHRDISPDNILLSKDNQPVLIDFGAARETVTRATRFLGAMRTVKDGYSPQEFYVTSSEQFPSSDLYSLAASLYHVLTQDIPVSAQERLAAIASGDGDSYVSIKKKVTGYPEPFLDAIDQALNVFPKNRIQSAAEWRAMITQSTVSRITRGKVSQPVLAVDNGNVLEQFERSKPQSLIGGLRRPDDPADAAKKAAGVRKPASGTSGLAEDDLKAIVRPAKKPASGRGLMMGVAALALIAILGTGAVLMSENASDSAPEGLAASDVPSVADAPVLDALEPEIAGREEAADTEGGADAPASGTAPALAPLPWELALRVGAADAQSSVGSDEQAVAENGASAFEHGVEEPIVRQASSIISGKALEFLVYGRADDPTVVQTSFGAAAEHLKPGLRIVSVNGYQISSFDEFQRIANLSTEYEVGDSVEMSFGLENPETGDAFSQTLVLPAVRQTMLMNGVSFQTRQTGEAWTTLVSTGTGTGQSDLQPGDRVVALMPGNEMIDTRDGLETLIQREIAEGNTQLNFAVSRGGTMWFATMRYAARSGI